MRILFIGKRHYTNQDALAEGFGRIVQLPLAWHRAGHAVRLLLLDYHSLRRETAVFEGLAAESMPLWSPAAHLQLARAVEAFRPDVIMASGDCFIGLIGLRLARHARARFAFDVYDDYRTFGAYRAFLGWDAMGLLCRSADAVTYASTAMAAKHRSDGAAIVVPNGVDEAVFCPMPAATARADLGLPQEGRLIGYFGSMSPQHGVAVLIDALAKLRKQHPDVRLLLCGPPHESVSLDADGVLYRGMVEHRLIPRYLNACDVLALPYARGRFIDNASSCKIAEYLFCRRPIVATSTPNFVENFPHQAGALRALLASPGDVDALASAIRQQLDDPVIVEPPVDMTWERIAARAMSQFAEIAARNRAAVPPSFNRY